MIIEYEGTDITSLVTVSRCVYDAREEGRVPQLVIAFDDERSLWDSWAPQPGERVSVKSEGAAPTGTMYVRSCTPVAGGYEIRADALPAADAKALRSWRFTTLSVAFEQLAETLDGVVEDCVNAVGVDINTASMSLLQRVSGLTKTTASNIVKYREENGAFTSRTQIKKVPKLGPKAFEQCAGFLRVPESKQILDNTAVHPESYQAAGKMLELCGYTLADVKKGGLKDLRAKFEAAGPQVVAEQCRTGVPTLTDIISELLKPGRDPREDLPPVVLRQDVLDIGDLREGMELTGTVRNVIDFGAFVDIGVHQDGLVHISQISNQYIRHPSEVLSVGDIVKVKVLGVDEKKGRISLTMKL